LGAGPGHTCISVMQTENAKCGHVFQKFSYGMLMSRLFVRNRCTLFACVTSSEYVDNSSIRGSQSLRVRCAPSDFLHYKLMAQVLLRWAPVHNCAQFEKLTVLYHTLLCGVHYHGEQKILL